MKPGLGENLINYLNTAVLWFDETLCLRYINAAGEIMFDTSSRLIVGQQLAMLFPQAPAFVQALSDALESDKPFTERELALELPNMQSITVNCTVTPVNEPGQTRSLLLEMNQVDRHLRIAREENLLAQNQTVRTLVRGLAHEIKNPLGGLRGAAQLLERELPSADLKEFTQVIIGEADRLQNLLDRMLGPNTPPNKRMINVHSVLEHVRTLVQAETESLPGIQLERDYDPSIPEVYGDPEQLIQVVLNLVRNALQALGTEGRILLRTRTQRQVTVGHKLHRLVMRIDIIDNGPGVPEHLEKDIFYPMVTGRADGTGLGLPIAQSVINQHGGLIECASRPGETVFTIYLPLENQDEQ